MTRHVFYGPDGTPLATTCVDKPLSAEATSALAAVVRAAFRDQEEQDPDNLMGDRQIRSINRIRKQPTPMCPHSGCARVADHDGRCLDIDGNPPNSGPTGNPGERNRP